MHDAVEHPPLGVGGVYPLLADLAESLEPSVQDRSRVGEKLVTIFDIVAPDREVSSGLSVANSLRATAKTSSMASNMSSIISAISLFS